MIISPTKYLLYYRDGQALHARLNWWEASYVKRYVNLLKSLISLRLGKVGVIAGSSIYTHYLSSESNPMDHI